MCQQQEYNQPEDFNQTPDIQGVPGPVNFEQDAEQMEYSNSDFSIQSDDFSQNSEDQASDFSSLPEPSHLTDSSSGLEQSVEASSIDEDEWKTDPSVYPEGWMFKYSQSKKDIMKSVIWLKSPSDVKIKGIRAAFAYIKANGPREDHLDMMRKAMIEQESWVVDPALPLNWMRRGVNNNIVYCNADGKLFTTKGKALEYLKDEGNSADYEKLSNFKGQIAYQIRKETSGNRIRKVRKFDSTWLVDDEVYPEGWKYKTISNGKNTAGKKTFATQICARTGEVFKGTKAAIAFMKDNGYSIEDIEKLTMAMKGKPQYSVVDQQVPEVSTMEADTSSVQSEVSPDETKITKKKGRKIDPSSWLVDEEVYPSGWKYRMCKNGPNRKDVARILTETGEVIRGNTAALAYMEKNNYPEGDKEKLKSFLRKSKTEVTTVQAEIFAEQPGVASVQHEVASVQHEIASEQ